MPSLDTIGKNIREILPSLLTWLRGVSKLTYAEIVKNLILAILILGVIYIAINMEDIKTMSSIVIWFFCGVICVFLSIQLILELNKDNKKKEHSETVKEERAIIDGKEQLNDELDSAMSKAVYRLKCSRIMVHSFHNGIRAFAGLPFLRMSVIKESINTDIPNNEMMADAYQNQMLSLYKFPSILNKKEYIICNIDDMKKIDYKFSCNMAMSGDKIALAIPLKNHNNSPIGFVIFGWRSNEDVPVHIENGKAVKNCSIIREEVRNICSLAKALLIVS